MTEKEEKRVEGKLGFSAVRKNWKFFNQKYPKEKKKAMGERV